MELRAAYYGKRSIVNGYLGQDGAIIFSIPVYGLILDGIIIGENVQGFSAGVLAMLESLDGITVGDRTMVCAAVSIAPDVISGVVLAENSSATQSSSQTPDNVGAVQVENFAELTASIGREGHTPPSQCEIANITDPTNAVAWAVEHESNIGTQSIADSDSAVGVTAEHESDVGTHNISASDGAIGVTVDDTLGEMAQRNYTEGLLSPASALAQEISGIAIGESVEGIDSHGPVNIVGLTQIGVGEDASAFDADASALAIGVDGITPGEQADGFPSTTPIQPVVSDNLGSDENAHGETNDRQTLLDATTGIVAGENSTPQTDDTPTLPDACTGFIMGEFSDPGISLPRKIFRGLYTLRTDAPTNSGSMTFMFSCKLYHTGPGGYYTAIGIRFVNREAYFIQQLQNGTQISVLCGAYDSTSNKWVYTIRDNQFTLMQDVFISSGEYQEFFDYFTQSPTVVEFTVSSDTLTQELHLTQSAANDVTVNWGDNSASESSSDLSAIFTHTYASEGVYSATISVDDGKEWSLGRYSTLLLTNDLTGETGDFYGRTFYKISSDWFPHDELAGATLNGQTVLDSDHVRDFSWGSQNQSDFDAGGQAFTAYSPSGFTQGFPPNDDWTIISCTEGYIEDGCSIGSGLWVTADVISLLFPRYYGLFGFRGGYKNGSYHPAVTAFKFGYGARLQASYAFSGCSELLSITIPPVSTTIPLGTAENCDHLSTLNICDGIEHIGENAFYGCVSVTDIMLPDSVVAIGAEAFYGCNATTLRIGSGLETVGGRGLPGLDVTAVYIKDVAQYCQITWENKHPLRDSLSHNVSFYLNGELIEHLTIPYGTIRIAPYSFSSSICIETVSIPSSISSIGEGSFYGHRNSPLREISVSSSNAYYSSKEGVLYNKSRSRLLYYPTNKPDLEFQVPGSVSHIEPEAFAWNRHLTAVAIPSTVSFVGEGAFVVCEYLSRVQVGAQEIDRRAFAQCDSLTAVWIRSTCTTITTANASDSPFDWCTNVIIYAEPRERPAGWGQYFNCTSENSGNPIYASTRWGVTTRPW